MKKLILPLLIFFVPFLLFLLFMSLLISTEPDSNIEGGGHSLSEEVLKYKPIVEAYAMEYEMEEYVGYLLAIMEVESGGKVPDLMQSSESAGLPVNTLEYEESIEQGVKYLASIVEKAKTLGLEDDYLAVIQSYNFGSGYINYLVKQQERHNLDHSELYSKEVVAPSLGNTTAERIDYSHVVAIENGRPYRYRNGGNFHYAYIVMQYVAPAQFDDEELQQIMNELLKYQGWSYVWGGYNPVTGFDCSGLTQWGYQQIGVTLPRTAQTQYDATIRISEEEVMLGDLVFFEGTHPYAKITHVGIVVGDGMMYDSNSTGVGYSNYKSVYWQQYFVGYGRVIR